MSPMLPRIEEPEIDASSSSDASRPSEKSPVSSRRGGWTLRGGSELRALGARVLPPFALFFRARALDAIQAALDALQGGAQIVQGDGLRVDALGDTFDELRSAAIGAPFTA